MSNINWSKAPEGATHYSAYTDKFYRYSSNYAGRCLEVFMFGNWGTSMLSEAKREQLIERPQAWNGEGLPPVGIECEYQRNDVSYKQAWVAVTPRYIGESITVLKHSASGNEFTEMTTSCVYRPIRTPEQIAAELAHQAIKKIAAIICRDGAFDIDDPEVTESAVALYDAGYRKVEGGAQ